MEKHKNTRHCSEDALSAYLAGIAEREDADHVAGCLDCYARLERARIEMEQLRNAAQELTSPPEEFWSRQRAAIMDRLPDVAPRFRRRWLWAPGAALAAAAVILVVLLWPAQVGPPARPSQEISDDVLLSEIQSDLARPVPRALEPVTLLVRARNDMAQADQRYPSQGEKK